MNFRFPILRRLGLELRKRLPHDLSAEDSQIISRVEPFTMTSSDRLIALLDAITYINVRKIPGCIVECGVWRGGSMMAAALKLLNLDDATRELFLFDTFEGMPEPGSNDTSRFVPNTFSFWKGRQLGKDGSDWCRSTRNEVEVNLASTKYPKQLTHCIEGKVEETIPQTLPGPIALLRLDTDWYDSTLHELRHLYPLLSEGGVLIIDDFGYWDGARKAVTQYFDSEAEPPILMRIDHFARMGIKVSCPVD